MKKLAIFVEGLTEQILVRHLLQAVLDRNRIAIQGDVLGASALGVCNVLCLTGDDVTAGDHPEAKPVFDLDSVSLMQTIRVLRDESRFLSGRAIETPPRFSASGHNAALSYQSNECVRLTENIS